MAIEDGYILSRALEAHGMDVATAFRAYELARYERTARVVNGSADNTKRFHNPLLGDPATAQAYVEREWAEDRLREPIRLDVQIRRYRRRRVTRSSAIGPTKCEDTRGPTIWGGC